MTTETKNTPALFPAYELELSTLEELYGSQTYDMSNKDDAKRARENKSKIIAVQKNLKAAHKEMKADVLERTRAIDGSKKAIDDRLEVLRKNIHDLEITERDRVKAIEDELNAKMQKINEIGAFGLVVTSEILKGRIEQLSEITIDESYKHYQEDAQAKYDELMSSLPAAYDKAVADEAEKAELEELRKKQAEAEKIKAKEEARLSAEKAAAEKAETDRKNAELNKKIAAEKAEKDKQDALAAQKKKLKEEAEAKEKAAADEIAKEQAEADARQSDKMNRAKIHTDIYNVLLETLDKEIAEKVLVLLADQSLPHIEVKY